MLVAQLSERFEKWFSSQVRLFLSAHRTPDLMFEYAETVRKRGIKAIIAGAGGAAHLPDIVAAKTTIPVLDVPVPSKYLRGEDSLFADCILVLHTDYLAMPVFSPCSIRQCVSAPYQTAQPIHHFRLYY